MGYKDNDDILKEINELITIRNAGVDECTFCAIEDRIYALRGILFARS
ncbi:hypothetical protein SAMN05216391_10916 [Lachnospiraceae bacterium KHCPX20]|nr:hypothetical protein SAMN05216391_10916 [Lachnospiraceae bacterium KHCPX20]